MDNSAANTELDASYLRTLLGDKIEIYIADKAQAGSHWVSLLPNLDVFYTGVSVVNRRILRRFQYNRLGRACPAVGTTETLSLHSSHSANPLEFTFQVVDNPRVEIQLSRADLELVSKIWGDTWVAVLKLKRLAYQGKVAIASPTAFRLTHNRCDLVCSSGRASNEGRVTSVGCHGPDKTTFGDLQI